MTSIACFESNPSFTELFGSRTLSTLRQSGIDEGYPIIPSMSYRLPIDIGLFNAEWVAYTGVEFLAGYEEQSRINVILDFASKLIENSKDIDPMFAKIAKDSFWDLI